MTDSLSEEAITARYSPKEAALEAVKAGADLLLCPEDFETAYQALVEAVNQGEIPTERIEEAVGRILTKKLAMLSD